LNQNSKEEKERIGKEKCGRGKGREEQREERGRDKWPCTDPQTQKPSLKSASKSIRSNNHIPNPS
jgi:hypothetical protein